jgi:hypothetical protein
MTGECGRILGARRIGHELERQATGGVVGLDHASWLPGCDRSGTIRVRRHDEHSEFASSDGIAQLQTFAVR